MAFNKDLKSLSKPYDNLVVKTLELFDVGANIDISKFTHSNICRN